jgi:hypothetical protein
MTAVKVRRGTKLMRALDKGAEGLGAESPGVGILGAQHEAVSGKLRSVLRRRRRGPARSWSSRPS